MIEFNLKGMPMPSIVAGMEMTDEQKVKVLCAAVDRLKDIIRQGAAADPSILKAPPHLVLRWSLKVMEAGNKEWIEQNLPPDTLSA